MNAANALGPSHARTAAATTAAAMDAAPKPPPADSHGAFDLFGLGPPPPPPLPSTTASATASTSQLKSTPSPSTPSPTPEHDDSSFLLFPPAAPSKPPPSPPPASLLSLPSSSSTFSSSSDSSSSSVGSSSTVPTYDVRKPSLSHSSSSIETTEDDFVLFPTVESDPDLYAAAYAVESSVEATTTARRLVPPSLPPSQFKCAGNAIDIIAVRSMDNRIFTTSWHVMFSWSRLRSNAAAGVGDTIRVLVNGHELPTRMRLLEKGRCTFVTGGLTPPTLDLLQVELFDTQPNLIRFEHVQRSTDTIRYVESRLHVWGPNESVVVADLDGTLTISDVEGHIRTLRLGQYDFLHKGACEFFNKLHELDLRIVYLTARPIDWAAASRTHLENAKQYTHTLPPGPLITNSNGLTGALLTEVINKNPHVFKAQVLNEIQLALIHAGRIVEHPVFVAGFGNRPTDVVAYEQVGVDPSLIFLIDPYSNLKATTDARIYESYSDPNALLWLLPKLKHKVPIEKVGRIDDYTVRELVLADDLEQLRMAEREARRLQEEEYRRATAAVNPNGLQRSSSLRSTGFGAPYAQ